MFDNVEDIFIKPIGFIYEIEETENIQKIYTSNLKKVDLYCPICKKERVFKGECICALDFLYRKEEEIPEKLKENDLLILKYECEYNHIVNIILEKIDEIHYKKIGQNIESTKLDPSIKNEIINQLDDNLKQLYYNALKSRNNNLNIGAFNYLRRIFESLIKEAKKKSERDFSDKNVKEQIKILVKDNLLNDIFIDEGFNSLYKYISEGVHNLTEEECSEQFELLNEAIITILEDELNRKNQEKRRKRIASKLSGKNNGKNK